MNINELTIEQPKSPWTPKKIMAIVAGILAILGAGGGGIYGANAAQESPRDSVQKQVDKVQDARINKCESAIENVHNVVIENAKGIATLLERTK